MSPASGDFSPDGSRIVSGSFEFPINRCHQRVVTAAPERACATSDPKTICAPSHLEGALTAVSTLWKTLRAIAPQDRTAINANAGISATPGGCTEFQKDRTSMAARAHLLCRSRATEQRPAGGLSPPCRSRGRQRLASDHLVAPGDGFHWAAELQGLR